MSLPSPTSDSTPESISPIDPHPIRHDRGELLLPSPVDEDDGLDDFCVAFDKAGVTRQPSNSSFFDNVFLDSRHSFPRPVSAVSERLSVQVEYKTKPLRVQKRIPRPEPRQEHRHPFARQDSVSSAHRAITKSFMVSSPIFIQPLPPVPAPPSVPVKDLLIPTLPPSPTDELCALRRPSFPAPLPSLPSTPASSRRYEPVTPRTPSSRRWDSPMTPSRAPNKAAKLLGVDSPAGKVKKVQLTSTRLIELQSLLEPLPNAVHAWKGTMGDQEFAALLPRQTPVASPLAPPVQLSVNGRVRPAPKVEREGQSLIDFFKGEDDVAAKKAARAKALARARGDFTDSDDDDEDFLDDKPTRTTGGRSALEKRLGVSMAELGPALAPKPKRPPRPEMGLSTPKAPLHVALSSTPSPPRPKHRPPPLNLTQLPPQRGLPVIKVISPSNFKGHRASKSDPTVTPRSTPSGLPVSAEKAQTPFAHPRAAPVPAFLGAAAQNRSVSTSAMRTVPHPALAAPPVPLPRSVSDTGPVPFAASRPSIEGKVAHVDDQGEPISFFEPETPTEAANGRAARAKAWQGIKRAVRL